NETRRKVLVGAMILAKVNSSEWPEDRLMAAMDAYLERDHDRALFGLPPRQKDEPA
ncbi:mobilization protein, partial [Salmonella enterica subsp. enterica serovar Typhimurium]|nr:mobilization protein [Salmonella enterica subsp. enterica serovar Typhimurium]